MNDSGIPDIDPGELDVYLNNGQQLTYPWSGNSIVSSPTESSDAAPTPMSREGEVPDINKRKRLYNRVPVERQDETYGDKRKRNNESVKNCRSKDKRIASLEQEIKMLRSQLKDALQHRCSCVHPDQPQAPFQPQSVQHACYIINQCVGYIRHFDQQQGSFNNIQEPLPQGGHEPYFPTSYHPRQ